MKTSLPTVKNVLAVISVVVLAAGCSSMGIGKKSGVERAESTTTSMQKVDADIRQANLQIDLTNTSLDSLMNAGQSGAAQPEDMKTAFNTFSDNADKMKEIGKDLNKHIDEMASQGNSYFVEWAKQGGTYTNPEIQKLSQDRRTELSSTFRQMELASADVRGDLNAYLSDLEQVQKYLSNDLSPQGMAAIRPVTETLGNDGNKLKSSLVPVEKSIVQARNQLSAGGAAAGGASGMQQQQQQQQQPQQQQ